ncbi:rRNA maturation RNase YbeY [soil metagenome]
MPVTVDITDAAWTERGDPTPIAERAVAAALAHEHENYDTCEISLLFAGDDEASRINKDWRDKSYAPNVLSFPAPASATPAGEARFLGDIVLAAGTVSREAAEQGKPLEAHVAHLIVHGTLHLLGYDHMYEPDAARMEGAEIEILRGLGLPNPYVT